MLIKREMNGVQDQNKFLEKRVRDLTAENQMFLA